MLYIFTITLLAQSSKKHKKNSIIHASKMDCLYLFWLSLAFILTHMVHLNEISIFSMNCLQVKYIINKVL